jgi:hypothetical protein
MADGVFSDTHSLIELAADLGRTAGTMGMALGTELAAGAHSLAEEARGIAANYPSDGSSGGAQAVADSVRTRRVSRREYRVEAGGPDAPLAGLWELGNKGSNPNDPTFRHPVYGGSAPWQNQRKWEFLRMALQRQEAAIMGRFERTVNGVLRRNRL